MLRIRPQPPATRLRFLTNTKSTREVSKTLKLVFSLILVIFSLNLGFIKFKSLKTTMFIKCLCALQASAVSFIISYFYSFTLEDPVFVIWYSLYLLEYCILAIASLCINKFTFFNFCNDLISIDKELGVDESSKMEVILIAWTSSCVVYRSSLSIIYCTSLEEYCINKTFVLILFFIPLLCADVFLIVGFAIYYSLYNRLKAFTNLVSNGNTDIVTRQYLYKSIVDVADSIRSSYNPLYLIPLLSHTVDMMIAVFYPLIKTDIVRKETSVILITNTSVLHTFVMLFSPAFAAGLMSAQVNQLKIVLHNRLLQERDQKHTGDIERFLGYIEVRNLKTTICQVVPLNWRLPIIFVNLSVTYLIVMLQFTHKY